MSRISIPKTRGATWTEYQDEYTSTMKGIVDVLLNTTDFVEEEIQLLLNDLAPVIEVGIEDAFENGRAYEEEVAGYR